MGDGAKDRYLDEPREHGFGYGESRGQYGRNMLEAVAKDQLNTGPTGQIRFRVSENNLYACLFCIRQPLVQLIAYFVSVLRQKIANFEAKADPKEAAPTVANIR